MKVFGYGVRDFDELAFFEKYAKEKNIEYAGTGAKLTRENLNLAAGYDAINITTNPVDAEMMDILKAEGVKLIATRTIGYDHIDIKHAAEIGMHVCNAGYTPECVADYTIMLMLMSIRKMKRIMQRAVINDFTLKGINGGLLCERTVGVIGTGRIGKCVIRDLKGFGCKVYAYDLYPDASLDVEYLPLDELLSRCNMITLHTPLTSENFHMIDKAAIEKMPQGTVIINTARGGLIDSYALIDALEQGKIGAAGLDVCEDEFNMYYYDRRSDQLANRALSIFRDMPNVVITPHMAFYTDASVSDMVSNSLQCCADFENGTENRWMIC